MAMRLGGAFSGTLAGDKWAGQAEHQAKLRARSQARRELTALRGERKAARTEEQRRYKAGLAELTEAAGLFGPEYTAGMEREALTGARAGLIGRGLGGTTRTALGSYLNILQQQATRTTQPIQYGGGASPVSTHPSQMAMAESYDIGGVSNVPAVDFSLPGGQPMPIGPRIQRAYASAQPALAQLGVGGAGTTGYSSMPRGTGKITAGGQTTYF